MLAEAFRAPRRADADRRPRRRSASSGAARRVGVASGTRDAHSFGVILSDNYALFFNIMLCIVGLLTMLFSDEVVERERLPAGEYYALMLFAIAGMMLMATATDLLVIFIALEIMSLAVYVLTGHPAQSAAGAEAAFKYFVLGAFSSAFFLYGIAFVYARRPASTRLDEIGAAHRRRRR